MFSKRLAAPFIFATLVVLYFTWEKGTSWAIYMLPFILITAIIYVMSPQLDWWWAKRNPPALAPKLHEFLGRFSPFYQALEASEKKRFGERAEMWMMATEWMPQGWESVPKDVQTALVSYGVMLNFRTEQLFFDKFEKVIMYQHPFPSPAYPDWHHSELFEPDGCLLFSAEQVMQGFFEQKKYYQIGLHEYAKAYKISFPEKDWPSMESVQWSDLQSVSGIGKEAIEAMVGMPVKDMLPVAIHHYFIYPQRFRVAFSELTSQFDVIFER